MQLFANTREHRRVRLSVVSMCVLVGFMTSLDPEINLYEVAAPSVIAFALTGDVMGRLFEG